MPMSAFRAVLPEVLQLLPLYGPAVLQRQRVRQAAKAGIGFTPLVNAFAAVDDVARVQAICDSLTGGKIEALAGKWLARLLHPFSGDDIAAGNILSIRESQVSSGARTPSISDHEAVFPPRA